MSSLITIMHVLFLYCCRSFLENKLHCQQNMICQLIGGSLLVSEALKKVLVFWFLKKDQISDHLGEGPIFVKFGAVILKTSKQKDLHFDLNFFAK